MYQKAIPFLTISKEEAPIELESEKQKNQDMNILEKRLDDLQNIASFLSNEVNGFSKTKIGQETTKQIEKALKNRKMGGIDTM